MKNSRSKNASIKALMALEDHCKGTTLQSLFRVIYVPLYAYFKHLFLCFCKNWFILRIWVIDIPALQDDILAA